MYPKVIGFISQVLFTVAVYRSLDGFSNTWTVPQALIYTWVSIYLSFIAIGIGKFAVIAFILVLQGPTHLRQRHFLYFLGASNIILDLIYAFFLAFRCSPVHSQFVLHVSTHCAASAVSARNFGYFVGSWNAATDLGLALYPIYLFWNIQLAPHVKWGVCAVMSLGLVACAVACVKTWDLMFVYQTTQLTYELYCILTWSYVEMWVVIITCSIPPLWPLVKRVVTSSRAGYNSAKGWVSSSSQSGGGWSRPSRRNTMHKIAHGQVGTTSSARGLSAGTRGRSDSCDKDVELLKHPQAIPQSMSKSEARTGRSKMLRNNSVGPNQSQTRGSDTAGKRHGQVLADPDSMNDDPESYEVYEPEHGVMMARDLARPGIVVTKEYTVETERKRDEKRDHDRNLSDFGSGRPMRHNWDDIEAV